MEWFKIKVHLNDNLFGALDLRSRLGAESLFQTENNRNSLDNRARQGQNINWDQPGTRNKNHKEQGTPSMDTEQ